MDYKIEELLPVAAKLMEKYTAYESTSVTYEKAQQLMEAVLYCIQETEQPAQADEAGIAAGKGAAKNQGHKPPTIEGSQTAVKLAHKKLTAQESYEAGYAAVTAKVRKALDLYHEILPEFHSWGNRCLQDTVMKGMPEFFKWYDAQFEPQNTILLLDYPVLKDLSAYTGIDRVYEYLVCIRMEQRFLKKFPEGYVTHILHKYSSQFQIDSSELIGNISEIVFLSVLAHILAQKPLMEMDFGEKEIGRIKRFLNAGDRGQRALGWLQRSAQGFLTEYYEDSQELQYYLADPMENRIIRLQGFYNSRQPAYIV